MTAENAKKSNDQVECKSPYANVFSQRGLLLRSPDTIVALCVEERGVKSTAYFEQVSLLHILRWAGVAEPTEVELENLLRAFPGADSKDVSRYDFQQSFLDARKAAIDSYAATLRQSVTAAENAGPSHPGELAELYESLRDVNNRLVTLVAAMDEVKRIRTEGPLMEESEVPVPGEDSTGRILRELRWAIGKTLGRAAIINSTDRREARSLLLEFTDGSEIHVVGL